VLIAALATAVVVIGVAAVVFFLARGGKTTAIGVGDAVQRFRRTASTTSSVSVTTAATTTAGPATTSTSTPDTSAAPVTSAPPTTATPSTTAPVTPALPEVGVYQYRTTGFDSVSILNGARHDYPAITTMTVTNDGCGVKVRWDVAKERYDETGLCDASGGQQMVSFRGYHQFFGVGDSNDFVCTGDPRPVDGPAGTTWTTICRFGTTSTPTTTSTKGTVLGYDQLVVDGTPVRTQHVRLDGTVAGGSAGTQTTERWVVPATGLVVKEIGTTDTTSQTVVGKTKYHEDETIDLVSLVPQR
jgi:hypothetical protein